MRARVRCGAMTSVSDVNASKLKFSVDSILGNNESSSPVQQEVPRAQEPPCAGCVAALYRCCRDEPPLLQLPLSVPYAHLHPALRPTTGTSDFYQFFRRPNVQNVSDITDICE